MKQIRLGRSELMVSQVGFGGIPITRVSFEEAERCIRAAMDLGVNFIDTANGYKDSEEKIGRAIQGCRDDLVIATKSPPKTAERMVECIELSLQRMRIDTIDLYQFHLIKDDDTLQRSLDLMGVLEKARDQGKIRHIGVTIHGVDYINKVLEVDVFETIMIALNYVVCEPAEVALPNARQRDVGVIAMKPMAGGYIEDAELAFKFFLELEGVVPLVGIETPQQIEEIVKIIEHGARASADEKKRMAAFRAASGDRFCRRCEYCMPCPQGVGIVPATLYKSFLRRLPSEGLVTGGLADAMDSVKHCTQCGACAEKCPYDLDIQAMLADNYALYEQLCDEHRS